MRDRLGPRCHDRKWSCGDGCVGGLEHVERDRHVYEVLVHDEGLPWIFRDSRDLHHRRLLDRGHPAALRKEPLAHRRISQELEGDDLLRRFVEGAPDLGLLVRPVKCRQPIAARDELTFLPLAGSHRHCGLRAVHCSINAPIRPLSTGTSSKGSLPRY